MKNESVLPKLTAMCVLAGLLLFSPACKKKSDGGDGPPTGGSTNLEITGIEPGKGAPGTKVTISGNGFSATASENKVVFSSTEAEVSSATESSLETSVPDGAASGKVSVTVDGETADGPAFTVLEPTATITSVVPDSGKWGDKIIITGENFADFSLDNTVTFNGAEAIVLRSSETELTAEVPKGAGSGPVVVTVNGQPSEGHDFNYLLTVLVSTWAGGAEGYADGQGLTAQFDKPIGIVLDSNGTIYVSDSKNNRIRKIVSDQSRTVSTFAGSGADGDTDGSALSAEFSSPTGLAIGPDGELYVADRTNHKIRKIAPDGTVTTVAGTGTAGFTDGTRAAAQFDLPNDVAVTSDGTIFVADYYNHSIRKITSDGEVSTLAGNGASGFVNGIGSSAQFSGPTGLALSPDETVVYVVDTNNGAIRTVHISTGEVSTLTGVGRVTSSEDGTLDEATFEAPAGIAVDGNGRIYVSQTSGYIRMISNGRVETIAGTGVRGYRDDTGSAAEFDYPFHLTVNQEGTVLFIADNYNNRIRRITVE